MMNIQRRSSINIKKNIRYILANSQFFCLKSNNIDDRLFYKYLSNIQNLSNICKIAYSFS